MNQDKDLQDKDLVDYIFNVTLEELIEELPRALEMIRAVTLEDSISHAAMQTGVIALPYLDPYSLKRKLREGLPEEAQELLAVADYWRKKERAYLKGTSERSTPY